MRNKKGINKESTSKRNEKMDAIADPTIMKATVDLLIQIRFYDNSRKYPQQFCQVKTQTISAEHRTKGDKQKYCKQSLEQLSIQFMLHANPT
jgi:hypothetical protein